MKIKAASETKQRNVTLPCYQTERQEQPQQLHVAGTCGSGSGSGSDSGRDSGSDSDSDSDSAPAVSKPPSPTTTHSTNNPV